MNTLYVFFYIEQEDPSSPGSGSASDMYGEGTDMNMASTCSYTFGTGIGELTSPSYPYDYPSYSNCHYLIQQPEGATIILEFKDMSIENVREQNKCYYDYVEVNI